MGRHGDGTGHADDALQGGFSTQSRIKGGEESARGKK